MCRIIIILKANSVFSLILICEKIVKKNMDIYYFDGRQKNNKKKQTFITYGHLLRMLCLKYAGFAYIYIYTKQNEYISFSYVV